MGSSETKVKSSESSEKLSFHNSFTKLSDGTSIDFGDIKYSFVQESEDLSENEMKKMIDSDVLDCAGKVVKGKIVSVDKKSGYALVDCGGKSECYVSLDEFMDGNEEQIDVVPNSEYEFMLRRIDGRKTITKVSRADAIKKKAFDEIVAAKESDSHIIGVCFSKVTGGLSVDYKGVICFVPGSHVDTRPCDSVEHIVGYPLEYKILTVDQKTGSVIISRKKYLEKKFRKDKESILTSIKEGDVLEGYVKNLTVYGAFVDLGGIDGLLHVTDMSWSRVSHPAEVVSIGQKVQVKLIKVNVESQRISLGMKQLQENPLKQLSEKYKLNTKVSGVIKMVAWYGLFVEIEDSGIEGLVYKTDLGWAKDHAKEIAKYSVGQKIECMILGYDEANQRISLSIKDLTDDPWKQFDADHVIGQKIKGTINNITEFGIFVTPIKKSDGGKIETYKDIDGLIYASDLTWSIDPSFVMKNYSVGQEIEAIYLGTNPTKQRIRFGIKQMHDDPFEVNKINSGDVVSGKIVEIKSDGVVVEIFGSVHVFIRKSRLLQDALSSKLDEIFTLDSSIDLKVIEYNPKTRKIVLSGRDISYKHTSDKGSALDSDGSYMEKALGNPIQVAIKDYKENKKDDDSKKDN